MGETFPRQMLRVDGNKPMSLSEAKKTSSVTSRYKDIPTVDTVKKETAGRWPYGNSNGAAMEAALDEYHGTRNKVTQVRALRDLDRGSDGWLGSDKAPGAGRSTC